MSLGPLAASSTDFRLCVSPGTASGLTAEQCHQLMTNEFLEQLETLDQSWMKRLSGSFGRQTPEDRQQ